MFEKKFAYYIFLQVESPTKLQKVKYEKSAALIMGYVYTINWVKIERIGSYTEYTAIAKYHV